MKKLIMLLGIAFILSACSNKTTWEYKIVKVAGQDAEVRADYSPKVFADQSKMLNKMGEEGWELVDIFTETNTEHCNFGDPNYVTGIQPNVRTAVLNFVFKRPSEAKPNSKETKK